MTRAESVLSNADEFLSDQAALDAAKFLMTDRLSEGHTLAIEAHFRALIAGWGLDRTAEYAGELADGMLGALVEARAWEKPARNRPLHRRVKPA